MTTSRGAFLLLLTLTSAAHAGHAADTPEIPTENILMVNKDGGAINPDPKNFKEIKNKREKGDPKNKRGDLDQYIDHMLVGLSRFCEEQRLVQDGKPCKVLFYFHGGLNSREASVRRATNLTSEIKEAGIYPIFVNWRSSLWSTWWDHAAHVHSGFWMDHTTVFAPYVIAADEVKALADLPVDWIAEARHSFPRKQEAGEVVLGTYQAMVKEADAGIDVNNLRGTRLTKKLKIPLLLDDRSKPERWLPHGTLLLTSWSKLLGGPFVVHAGGRGAWDIMQRRTAMLFRTEAEFRRIPPEAVKEERTGVDTKAPQPVVDEAAEHDTGAALAYFITRFERDFLPKICRGESYVPPDPSAIREEAEPQSHEEGSVSCPHRLEITLVGHSMGTIILDRLLRYAPNLEVKNIVFMGAATSVEDYRDTVDAYLDRHRGNGEKGTGTQMYHLVLHPLAEATERNAWDFAPRGSLLVWIDNYFTDPTTPLGRRVGRFSNVVPELQFAADGIKKQIHLKVFRMERDLRCSNPRKHGDFGRFPFWDERFWKTDTPMDDTSPVRRLGKDGQPEPRCQKP
ncbi:MAG TPA: hypothetical protein VH394_18825 [Thermoanaerobaculia bacterium]|nr:hypothetical protein [Thermoanaerobaculia bacterium]